MALNFYAVSANYINLGFQLKPTLSTLISPTRLRFCNSTLGNIKGCTKSMTHRYALLDEQDSEIEEVSFTDEENSLIEALIGIQGRGRSASPQQLSEVERAVQVLEGLEGVPDPTSSSLIEGKWQLMFTTRPGTASPIQRTFVGVDFFSVFQEIYLRTNDPRVSNIVKFSDAIGELKVEFFLVPGSLVQYHGLRNSTVPLSSLLFFLDDGKVRLWRVSERGNMAVASTKNGKRILFQFDRAAFSLKVLPFKVPYPVPFRLLGDEAKGWLDTTYLSHSGNLRISRGNKGTTFVLQKKTEPRQKLLSAISNLKDVQEAIDEFISFHQKHGKDQMELAEGEWQMIWSSQTETDSWLENAANGLMGKQIVKKSGQIKFLVDVLLGIKFSMTGTLAKSGPNTYDVNMDDAALVAGGFGYPLEMESKFNKMEVLYGDQKIRITRGHSKITFVHLCSDGS